MFFNVPGVFKSGRLAGVSSLVSRRQMPVMRFGGEIAMTAESRTFSRLGEIR